LERIHLPNGVWSYDTKRPLGRPGGFGAVFHGSDEQGHPVAVKRLHVSAKDAAHRELTIAVDLGDRSFQHVMPILDAGQDAESDGYFIVMPIAERSLQDRLDAQGPMSEPEAAEVMSQIAAGMEEVGHIVHRDLKPQNILYHEGRLCIADFGIARFIEDSTSTETLKECLSPQYAAPEQWRLERATAAADVYALGCIGYALVTGAPPFSGDRAELQDKHLNEAPPNPTGCGPQMRALLLMMLRKPPTARPNLGRIKTILGQIRDPAPPHGRDAALERLAAAGAAHAHREAQADAERSQKDELIRQRVALADDARKTLVGIFEDLARRISAAVPGASIHSRDTSHSIRVGTATLEIDLVQGGAFGETAFPRSGWDVICGAVIEVSQSRPEHKRAASLWYTKQNNRSGDYRWCEVGYEGNPLAGRGFEFEPAAVTPELADRAHSHAMDVIQSSYPPLAIDDEDLDAFCRRWAFILAEACEGRLQNLPRNLPRDP
jgi:hypothetical protein